MGGFLPHTGKKPPARRFLARGVGPRRSMTGSPLPVDHPLQPLTATAPPTSREAGLQYGFASNLRNRYDRRIARPSHIRPAILKLLAERSRHGWSIDELTAALHERGVRADFSSVFRSLARLEREEAVERVELDDGKARYEAAGDHHEHIRCESCGSVSPVPCGLVGDVLPAVQRRTGYEVWSHRLVLSGLCPACAEGGSS